MGIRTRRNMHAGKWKVASKELFLVLHPCSGILAILTRGELFSKLFSRLFSSCSLVVL